MKTICKESGLDPECNVIMRGLNTHISLKDLQKAFTILDSGEKTDFIYRFFFKTFKIETCGQCRSIKSGREDTHSDCDTMLEKTRVLRGYRVVNAALLM